MRKSGTDWVPILVSIVIAAAFIAAGFWAASQPTCYGVEPDGEVETLWPCPPGHRDGGRFNIQEDEFADREIDD